MALLMGDWSDPGTSVITGVDAVAFYIGGWTPHVWTTTQIKAQTALMLPIWVYNPNKPGGAQGTVDGQAAVARMQALGIPTGVRCVIDMEAVVDAPYVEAFRNAIASAGYWTTIYGSAAFVFGNWPKASGPGGGWWPADWTGSPHLYSHAGVWATQYARDGTGATGSGQSWDLSVLASLDHLWAQRPVTFALTATAGSATKTANFVVG